MLKIRKKMIKIKEKSGKFRKNREILEKIGKTGKNVAKLEFPDPCKYCQMQPGRFARENPSIGHNMETYE